jgi:hypothetical protein
MASAQAQEIRPRTAGEILDDAWRVYLADAPRLLLLHGLFHVPAFCLVLLLVTTQPAWLLVRVLLMFVTALSLPLTGLGSGAVQERLRRLAEGRDPSLFECVGAALRRGLEHAAVRTLLLLNAAVAAGCLLVLPAYVWNQEYPTGAALLEVLCLGVVGVPCFALWSAGATLHTLIADTPGGMFQALGRVGGEMRFNPGKAAAVVGIRLPMLLMAFINANVLIQVAVWVAGNLAGLDVAMIGFQLQGSNPAYSLALFFLVWLLLAPVFEASNYLFYLDTRTRREGLDLLFRVRRAFGAVDPRRAAVVLAAAGCLVCSGPLFAAAPEPLATVRTVRQEVEKLRDQTKDAEAYDGAAAEARLRVLGDKLGHAWPGEAKRFAWYENALTGFRENSRPGAVRILNELIDNLILLEDSLSPPADTGTAGAAPSKDDIKKLLRERNDEPPAPGTKPKKREKPRDEQQDEEPKNRPTRTGGEAGVGPGAGPAAPAGLGNVCWLVTGGLALAVIVTGLVLFLANRPRRDRPAAETGRPKAVSLEETVAELHQQPIAALLRRADELAQQGKHLEALRAAYLAVLSLLHRKHLLRYEPTRTNGEYVREVRLAPNAPPSVHAPFNRFTLLFEEKWYGGGACDAAVYNEGRAFVETIHEIVGGK